MESSGCFRRSGLCGGAAVSNGRDHNPARASRVESAPPHGHADTCRPAHRAASTHDGRRRAGARAPDRAGGPQPRARVGMGTNRRRRQPLDGAPCSACGASARHLVSARIARRAACGRDRRGHPRPSGRDRLRRDRIGKNDAAAEDLPRPRPRRARIDRAHAAAPDCRAYRRGPHRARARSPRRRTRSDTKCASPITRGRMRSSS